MPRKAPITFEKRSYSMWYSNVQRYREALSSTKGAPFELDFFRAELKKLIGTACPYCCDKLKLSEVSLDHKIPTSRADEFAATLSKQLTDSLEASMTMFAYDRENVTPSETSFMWLNTAICCKRCNRAKGDLTDFEFLSLRCFISTLPTKAMRYIYTKLSSVPMRFFGKAQNARANKKTSVLAQPGEDF